MKICPLGGGILSALPFEIFMDICKDGNGSPAPFNSLFVYVLKRSLGDRVVLTPLRLAGDPRVWAGAAADANCFKEVGLTTAKVRCGVVSGGPAVPSPIFASFHQVLYR